VLDMAQEAKFKVGGIERYRTHQPLKGILRRWPPMLPPICAGGFPATALDAVGIICSVAPRLVELAVVTD